MSKEKHFCQPLGNDKGKERLTHASKLKYSTNGKKKKDGVSKGAHTSQGKGRQGGENRMLFSENHDSLGGVNKVCYMV